MTLEQAINAALLIAFLRRLVQDADGKVFLILDNLKAHKAPAVAQWLATHREKIEVFYLPSYSPELNPDELLKADLKEAISKQAPKRHKGELKQAVSRQLRKLARWPERVKQYFRAPDIAYAA